MLYVLRCYVNRIQTGIRTKNVSRNYMKVSERMEMLLKKSDQIPRDYEIIYRHKNYKMGTIMYHSVNFGTCVILSCLGFYYYSNGFDLESINKTKQLGKKKIFDSIYQIPIFLLASIGIVWLAAMIRNRYVVRIYFNPKTNMYRAIFFGKVPFTSEFYDFPKHTLTYVAKDSILPWRSPLFDAKGRKVFLYDDKFRTQADFYEMLKPGELEV